MRYARIIENDIANGPGVRVSLFVQGCKRHCTGCFNPETWDYNGGMLFTKNTEDYILDVATPDNISGLSILGGEPFDYANELTKVVRHFRNVYPEKSVMIWTGYTWGELITDECKKKLLTLTDILVDGPFIQDLKDPRLVCRGSSNQRVIDVKKSLRDSMVVLWPINKEKNGKECFVWP